MQKDYSRRDFIKQNASGLGMLAIAGTAGCGVSKLVSDGQGSSQFKITGIGDMSLEQLRDKYRSELFSNFIPNMDKYAIDHEYGGVMCSLDVRTGVLSNTNKTAWYVGRGLWVYSFLYNNLEQNPRYLEIARKSKDLLLKLQPKDDSFWPRNFTREGNLLPGAGDIFGSLLVAEGLFEFAKAAGEKQYRELAKKIIFDCVARYDRPDYVFEVSLGRQRETPKIQGPRVLGHWMNILNLVTQMLVHEPDTDLEKLAARCVDAVMKHHVNAESGLTSDVLNRDFSLPNNDYAQFSITGQGLETLVFVMFEAARRKDIGLFKAAEPVFKKIVDVSMDPVYGGYFGTLQHVDNYIWNVGKSLWCQQEVLNGTLFLIEHTGDEWAKRHFARTDNYVFEKFFSPGYKFWYSGGDRKMVNPSVNLLEHYHHARQLMLGILALERMINRGGRISGLFA